jgi:hypothetical protein
MLPLALLHLEQAITRLLRPFAPPALRGSTWSRVGEEGKTKPAADFAAGWSVCRPQ